MGNLVTFWVKDIRALDPSPKVLKGDPDRFVTVSGSFYPTIVDPKDNVRRPDLSNPFTYTSKPISNAQAMAEGFSLDTDTGYLTLPEGSRGRPVQEGLSQSTISDRLAALRAAAEAGDTATDPENTGN